MRTDFAQDDVAVQHLYLAAAGMVTWNCALGILDRAIGSVTSQMVVVDKSNGHLVFNGQPEESPNEAVLDYVREYHRIDPHAAYIATRPIGEPVHTADRFPPESMRDHPLYRDFWIPYNVRSLVGAKLAEDTRYLALIGVRRHFSDPAYSGAEVLRVGRFISHLVTAFSISNNLQHLATTSAVGRSIMAGSSRPMILVASDLRVLTTNAAASDVLHRRVAIASNNDVLLCADPNSHRCLVQKIRNLEMRGQDGEVPSRAALRIVNPHGGDLFCSVWKMHPDRTMGVFGPNQTFLLTLSHLRSSSDVDKTFLASLFELTPAECRVAQQVINGESVHSISRLHQVSVNTVRSQVRALFAKTCTSRLSELTALLIRATSV